MSDDLWSTPLSMYSGLLYYLNASLKISKVGPSLPSKGLSISFGRHFFKYMFTPLSLNMFKSNSNTYFCGWTESGVKGSGVGSRGGGKSRGES